MVVIGLFYYINCDSRILESITYLATTLKTDTVMDKKAICERETALESAIDGQASPPLPPSRFMYITASPIQFKVFDTLNKQVGTLKALRLLQISNMVKTIINY